MAWADEPTDEAIVLVCEILGVAKPEAIARLKANNNDPDRAVSEYFDDPTGSKYQWDESAFGADRQGNTSDTGISFNIQGPDEPGSFHNSAAPTRPPSRTNNRSPLGKLTDWTASTAPEGVPTSTAQEDADLQRALAESAAESGVPPQESGVIGGDANVKYFGPASRSEMEYAGDQWAMVPTKAEAAAQSKLEPAPTARKREPGAPVFLRSKSPQQHRLASLVTILHNIPMARNLLLSSGHPARSYGHNSEWWKGQPILKSEALEALNNDQSTEHYPDFSEELHRLVAFLDGSERSYGSVDALTQTDAIDPTHGAWPGDLDLKVIEAIANEGGLEGIDLRPIWNVAKTQPILKENKPERELQTAAQAAGETDSTTWDAHESDSDLSEQATFFWVDINLEADQNVWVNSLYDALDTLFWNHALNADEPISKDSTFAFLSQVGEIFTIRIGGNGLTKPCDIPECLFLDRYMRERKDVAVVTQTQINRIRRLYSKYIPRWESSPLCTGETGCRKEKWFDNKPHTKRECWEKVITSSEYVINRQRRTAQWRHLKARMDAGFVPEMSDLWLLHNWEGPSELTGQEHDVNIFLEEAIRIGKQRLEELDDDQAQVQWRKNQCLDCLDQASRRLTCREEDADDEFKKHYITPDDCDYYHADYWNPTHGYHLRGVATTHEVTYVCSRGEAKLVELDDQPGPRDQWWRVSYAAAEATPVSVQKTDIETVLLAAGTECKNPILVYATESAMDAAPTQLSDALRMFVRADNKSYQQELNREQTQGQPAEASQGGSIPLTADAIKSISYASPAKRKLSSGGSSVATIASNDSRDLEMTFSDQPEAFPEFVSPSPVPQSNRLGGIVESLENCRTFEPESPLLGRQQLAGIGQTRREQAVQDSNGSRLRGPEMQERGAGPSPLFARAGRPSGMSKADEPAAMELVMDMDMDIDVEHHEG